MLWGLLLLMSDPQAGEPDEGVRTLILMGDPLQYNYFPVCGLPTWQICYLVISQQCSFYHLVVAFVFVCRITFFFFLRLKSVFVDCSAVLKKVFCKRRWAQILLLHHLVSSSWITAQTILEINNASLLSPSRSTFNHKIFIHLVVLHCMQMIYSLHSWNKSHLVKVYYLISCWTRLANMLLRIFIFYVH